VNELNDVFVSRIRQVAFKVIRTNCLISAQNHWKPRGYIKLCFFTTLYRAIITSKACRPILSFTLRTKGTNELLEILTTHVYLQNLLSLAI